MRALISRILAGEQLCPAEILQDNIDFIIRREKVRAQAGQHDPDGCKVKNCDHGIGSDLPYAQELLERARQECTCKGTKCGTKQEQPPSST